MLMDSTFVGYKINSSFNEGGGTTGVYLGFTLWFKYYPDTIISVFFNTK